MCPSAQPARRSARDIRPSVSGSALVRLDAAKDELLDAAGEIAGEAAATVMRAYWSMVAAEDLIDRTPEDIADTVRRHLAAGAGRPTATPVVAVAAARESHAGHTTIDIVTDDMPFLVDSVTAALRRSGRNVALVVHPQFTAQRDAAGSLLRLAPKGDVEGLGESWMHIECALDPERPEDDFADVEALLREALADVRVAVSDWPAMRARAEAVAAEVAARGGSEAQEAADFLRWLADNHFTFLGYREYDLLERDGKDYLAARAGTGLGVLQDSSDSDMTPLSDAARAAARDQRILVLTKANSRATVHRDVYLDYIGVKQFAPDGSVAGEARFLGLFTSSAYVQPVHEVPVLAGKVAEVMAKSGFSPDSHSGKDLMEFLETYPRDELFQIDAAGLGETAQSVLQMAGRRVTRVFLRPDRYGRFVSAVVYLPTDRYDSDVRRAVEGLLRETLGAFSIDTASRVGEHTHARLHIVARTHEPVMLTDEMVQHIRAGVAAAARSWDDGFADAVLEALGERDGARLLRSWMGRFSPGYQADHSAARAVVDAQLCESMHAASLGAFVTLAPQASAGRSTHLFSLYTTGEPVLLSAVLPLLQNLGVTVVDERPYELLDATGRKMRLYEFGIDVPAGVTDPDTLPERFAEAFLAAWRGETENFYLDAVVTCHGMTARQATILRAYARYLRQTSLGFSMRYLEEIVLAHPVIARMLIELFEVRLAPEFGGDRESEARRLNALLSDELQRVVGLDADRILRGLLALVNATLRTNAYVRDEFGALRPYLSFKLDSSALGGLIPSPLPFVEIWVCSPTVEGVHLRFGRVARGGLRWSDRRDDVRTEVLGLVKAQMVKNTVIVPVGAKGGFVVQHPVPAAQDRLQQGIDCYRTFVRGLMDVTDNVVDARVVPPVAVVRHDGDDPYLVVAADKGTATFSDIANAISAEYGFWLADAFASGGSAGYDHKAMGITAKGAWESVKRHFRELGLDTQAQEFTAVGIGDMSGDVFGNGMLCSERIRLVAAFDHRHIFIDPAPDAAASYAERSRMFTLPRSSWADYDPARISAGGGVFPRDAKSIHVTEQMASALGLPDGVAELTPDEVIRAILQAPVDLLWNGGIGTYVKAATESHSDVGDKSNDLIRVDGRQLRCRVVGEGGNLGLTQLGRVEAAASGVKLNTDAIDNSAGVDTSDHEVNIKIFFDPLIRSGEMTVAERDRMLAEMTDQVAHDVLRDNYLQNVVLGNARARSAMLAGAHRRFMQSLEDAGILTRALEFLPSDEEMRQRETSGDGLTSPELCVLLAYAKLHLNEELTRAGTADAAGISDQVGAYFPALMQQRFGERLSTHPLRAELITTMLVNEIVNRGGITFAFRAVEETGADYGTIALSFEAVRRVFSLDDVWAAIEALDGAVSTATQCALYLEVRRLVDRATRWFVVTHGAGFDLQAAVARLAPIVRELAPQVPGLLQGAERERLSRRSDEFVQVGVPADLATKIAALLDVFSVLDVAEVSARIGTPPEHVARMYFLLSERYEIDRLLGCITGLRRDDRWNTLARAAMRADVYAALAALTARVLRTGGEGDAGSLISNWERQHASAVGLARQTLAEVVALEAADLATLSVAVRAIRSLLARSERR
ncbi:MAG: NAD-glutamate dehydrogenase [Actinomycetales bacterium]|nr:NAD-glutamate dehydrogenase [Actinomycetales bacterium]